MSYEKIKDAESRDIWQRLKDQAEGSLFETWITCDVPWMRSVGLAIRAKRLINQERKLDGRPPL